MDPSKKVVVPKSATEEKKGASLFGDKGSLFNGSSQPLSQSQAEPSSTTGLFGNSKLPTTASAQPQQTDFFSTIPAASNPLLKEPEQSKNPLFQGNNSQGAETKTALFGVSASAPPTTGNTAAPKTSIFNQGKTDNAFKPVQAGPSGSIFGSSLAVSQTTPEDSNTKALEHTSNLGASTSSPKMPNSTPLFTSTSTSQQKPVTSTVTETTKPPQAVTAAPKTTTTALFGATSSSQAPGQPAKPAAANELSQDGKVFGGASTFKSPAPNQTGLFGAKPVASPQPSQAQTTQGSISMFDAPQSTTQKPSIFSQNKDNAFKPIQIGASGSLFGTSMQQSPVTGKAPTDIPSSAEVTPIASAKMPAVQQKSMDIEPLFRDNSGGKKQMCDKDLQTPEQNRNDSDLDKNSEKKLSQIFEADGDLDDGECLLTPADQNDEDIRFNSGLNYLDKKQEEIPFLRKSTAEYEIEALEQKQNQDFISKLSPNVEEDDDMDGDDDEGPSFTPKALRQRLSTIKEFPPEEDVDYLVGEKEVQLRESQRRFLEEKAMYEDQTAAKEKKFKENGVMLSVRLAVARKATGELTRAKKTLIAHNEELESELAKLKEAQSEWERSASTTNPSASSKHQVDVFFVACFCVLSLFIGVLMGQHKSE